MAWRFEPGGNPDAFTALAMSFKDIWYLLKARLLESNVEFLSLNVYSGLAGAKSDGISRGSSLEGGLPPAALSLGRQTMRESHLVDGEGSQQMTADFFIPDLDLKFSALQVGRTLLAIVVALPLRPSLCFD